MLRHHKGQRSIKAKTGFHAGRRRMPPLLAQRDEAISKKLKNAAVRCNRRRMTEFKRAERRRRIRGRISRSLAAAGCIALLMAGIHSFTSEGIPRETGAGGSSVRKAGTEQMRMLACGWEDPEVRLALQTNLGETEEGLPAYGKEPAEDGVCLGEFEVTGYCGCDICCGKKPIKLTKTGTIPRAGHTVAVDPGEIPLGSSIVVGGVTYKAEDTGHAIKGKSLDIFFASHEEAIKFGRQKLLVYVKQSL